MVSSKSVTSILTEVENDMDQDSSPHIWNSSYVVKYVVIIQETNLNAYVQVLIELI